MLGHLLMRKQYSVPVPKKETHLILRFLAFFKHTKPLICIFFVFLLRRVYTFPVLGTGTQLPFLFLRMGNGIPLRNGERNSYYSLIGCEEFKMCSVLLENTNLRTDSLSKVLNNLLKFFRKNEDAVMKIADIAEAIYELIV